MNRTKHGLTLLLTVCVLALVASLSGTAYAALGKGSVGSKVIKNGAVKAIDLATGSVTSAKVADGTLAGADLAPSSIGSSHVQDGSLTGVDLANGSVGAADLAAGSVGATQLGQIITVQNTTDSISDADGTTNGGSFGTIHTQANCPAGSRVLSGGAEWVEPSSGSVDTKMLLLHSSKRIGNGWTARGIVDMGAQGEVKFRVFVDCLAVAGAQQ